MVATDLTAGGPVIVPPKLLYRTIRSQIDAAARQLRSLAGRGLPLVVVLSNPSAATVLLDPPTLFHAMYGGGNWAVPDAATPSIDQWPMPTAAGRDGALTASHHYISAVAALRTRRDPAAPFDAPPARAPLQLPYVHVIDTLSAAAIPVPAHMSGWWRLSTNEIIAVSSTSGSVRFPLAAVQYDHTPGAAFPGRGNGSRRRRCRAPWLASR